MLDKYLSDEETYLRRLEAQHDYLEDRQQLIRRKRLVSCSDRMCGADDCATCYPGRWLTDEDGE